MSCIERCPLPGLLIVQRPLIKSPTASSPTDEIYLMEPIGQSGTGLSETTPDAEHECQYIEATYDLTRELQNHNSYAHTLLCIHAHNMITHTPDSMKSSFEFNSRQ